MGYGAQARVRRRRAAKSPRCVPFLPRKGEGLALSASDIETYRSCPLRYKFARVLRIPTEQTLDQRFGIVVHQVLERYHAAGGETLTQLLELFDAAGAAAALARASPSASCTARRARRSTRYHDATCTARTPSRCGSSAPFSFTLGPHHLRGRVDRVDRLAWRRRRSMS